MTKKDLKITEHFKLNKTQAEVDFIDIYVSKDVPLFLDPWAIRQWSDDFSISCHSVISSFFEQLLEYVIDWDESNALSILSWLREPSETHLWFSKWWISWSWIWKIKAIEIYKKLKDSDAVRTWFLNDLEDTALMIEGIKEDNISDIVTNLLRYQLIKYTQEQCDIYGIEMRDGTPTWYYWNETKWEWEASRGRMLVIDWKKVILVPKLFVTKTLAINFSDYYNFEILEFEQALHLSAGSSLCKTLKAWRKSKPTKKDLKQEHPKNKKEYVYKISKENPKLLDDFKKKRSDLYKVLSDESIDEDLDLRKIIHDLILELKSIDPWKKDAYKYEHVVLGILQIIFYPELYKPTVQYKINGEQKIIDITYQNTARNWFFFNLIQSKIACKEIYFECKNYKNDLKNPEVDQLNGRFNSRVSEIGFLVYRKIDNIDDFNKRIDFFINQWHFIIGLSDNDLITLLNHKLLWRAKEINDFLEAKINRLIT